MPSLSLQRRPKRARAGPVLWAWAGLGAGLGLSGCAEPPTAPAGASTGATTATQPRLPEPATPLLPTVNIAPAIGWAEGAAPTPAAGLQVQAFARGLNHPRWLHVLPNGDVLVAESNAPARPDGATGLRAWVMKKVMARAGAGVPSADRITLLRDADGDGVAEQRSVFASGIASPFGMALVGRTLYVAATDAVLALPYTPGALQAYGAPRVLTALPAGLINHHWTKNLIASTNGKHLYVTVGSNSNAAENGLAAEEGRAAIWQVDLPGGAKRLYATGLRNPNGLAWLPGVDGLGSAGGSGTVGPADPLWTVVNERDELGDDLVPDYLTAVAEGGFYGWPYSWFGHHVDKRVQPPRPDPVATARVPDYALGAHVAALGLAWSAGSRLPAPFTEGMFIGEHGSWNRRPMSGYAVVFVPFAAGRPLGQPVQVLGGFVNAQGQAQGRPVGVVVGARGGRSPCARRVHRMNLGGDAASVSGANSGRRRRPCLRQRHERGMALLDLG